MGNAIVSGSGQVQNLQHSLGVKIKFDEGLVFKKLNPRWCVKGGTMGRDLYKAHSETLRISSLKTLFALYLH